MTEEALQQLRDRMAEVMGWSQPLGRDWFDKNRKYKFWYFGWKPDEPNGQVEMLIDKMRELGWRLSLYIYPVGKSEAYFTHDNKNLGPYIGLDNCHRKATMLAIEATGVGQKDEKED